MSQTRKPEGRPAKAKFELPGARVMAKQWFSDIYGLSPDHSNLTWRIPFAQIIQGLQTVQGIAALAGVTRKTIYRQGLPLDSVQTFGWLIERFSGTVKPLVKHADASHLLNRNALLLRMELVVQDYIKLGPRAVKTMLPPLNEDGTPKHAEDVGKRKWKRKTKLHHAENAAFMTDEEREEHNKEVRDGRAFLYRPQGRATVKHICSMFGWQRRQFYRWKDTLVGDDVERLKIVMAGNPPVKKSAYDWTLENETFIGDSKVEDTDNEYCPYKTQLRTPEY